MKTSLFQQRKHPHSTSIPTSPPHNQSTPLHTPKEPPHPHNIQTEPSHLASHSPAPRAILPQSQSHSSHHHPPIRPKRNLTHSTRDTRVSLLICSLTLALISHKMRPISYRSREFSALNLTLSLPTTCRKLSGKAPFGKVFGQVSE